MTTSMERQEWLEKAVCIFREHFKFCGYTIPSNVRVSIGLPKGRHGGKKAVGQCWSSKASKDEHFEIFASPEYGHAGQPNSDVTIYMLETIAHELVHATVGTECGHKGMFKSCALAVGFMKPFTTTPSSETMKSTLRGIIATIGEFPAGALNVGNRKTQPTRLLKCQCEVCDYTVRVTQKWIDAAGTPICPTDMESMICC